LLLADAFDTHFAGVSDAISLNRFNRSQIATQEKDNEDAARIQTVFCEEFSRLRRR
jgi:hypothetical protein